MTPIASAATSTQAEKVFDRLRNDVLSSRLPPGSKIRINEIALQLGVSLGAVREALSRLSAEGMVVAQAQKGYSVASVSEEELLDLTTTRVSIEQLCLRRAVEHGDVEWETGVVATFHRLHRISERDARHPDQLNETWSEAHAAFHAALVSACRSPCLLRIRSMLYAQSERYRRLSVPLRREDRDVDAEHRGLMEAAVAKQPDALCQILSDHLWRTTQILLSAPEILSRHKT